MVLIHFTSPPAACAGEMLVELDLRYSVNRIVGCAMEHHLTSYRGHLGNPLKKINC